MSSEIPRLSSSAGTAKTDDEKLANLLKGARPKQRVEPYKNMRTNVNLEVKNKKSIQNGTSKLIKNKNELPSGMTNRKTAATNKNSADFPKKECLKKGCVPEHGNIKTVKLSGNRISSIQETTQKKMFVKTAHPENQTKTEFKNNKTSNKSDMSSEFAGLVLTPKVRRSYGSPFDLYKSRRRSLSAPGNPSDKGKDKINGNQIVHTNKSKTTHRRDSETTSNMTPALSDSMKSDLFLNKVAQDEFLMTNKKKLPSEMTILKTTSSKKNIPDFSKKEITKKGCVPEHKNIKTLKLSENKISSVQENIKNKLSVKNAKPENNRTEFKNKKTANKSDMSSEIAGFVSNPKVHQSCKSPSDLGSSRRRSLSAPGKPTEKRKDKINGNQIVHTNISKTMNRRDSETPSAMSLEFLSTMKSELAQNKLAQVEFLASKKDVPHGGLEFRPKLKKRKSIFNFNINKS